MNQRLHTATIYKRKVSKYIFKKPQVEQEIKDYNLPPLPPPPPPGKSYRNVLLAKLQVKRMNR
jgi:hypothetical protein